MRHPWAARPGSTLSKRASGDWPAPFSKTDGCLPCLSGGRSCHQNEAKSACDVRGERECQGQSETRRGTRCFMSTYSPGRLGTCLRPTLDLFRPSGRGWHNLTPRESSTVLQRATANAPASILTTIAYSVELRFQSCYAVSKNTGPLRLTQRSDRLPHASRYKSHVNFAF